MGDKDPKDNEAQTRIKKQRKLETDLSGALMSGRIAARTETRVRVQKVEVDQQDAESTAASVPRPAPQRRPAMPPTTRPSARPGAPVAKPGGKTAPVAQRNRPIGSPRPTPTSKTKRVAWDPKRLRLFITGVITLGELEGISKDEQYEMAALGHRNLQAGKLEAARKVFEGLATLDPRDAYFHLVLGSIAQRQERLDDAQKAYSRSLELDPTAVHAYANRGEVRMLQGDMVEGTKDLLAALKLDPEAKEEATRRARATISVVMQQLEAPKKAPAPRGRAAPRAGAPRRAAPRRGAPRAGPRRPGRPRR